MSRHADNPVESPVNTELVKKRAVGRRDRFAGLFNFDPDTNEQLYRRHGDEPHWRSFPPWPVTVFHGMCHIPVLSKEIPGL